MVEFSFANVAIWFKLEVEGTYSLLTYGNLSKNMFSIGLVLELEQEENPEACLVL